MQYSVPAAPGEWLSLTNVGPLSVAANLMIKDPLSIDEHRSYRVLRLPQSLSAPKFVRLQPEGDVLSLSFEAEADTSYTVEYCDSLLSGLWTKLTSVNPLPAPALVTFFDSMQTLPQRFYRLTASDPTEAVQVEISQIAPVSLKLYFTGESGRSYTIEYADSLSTAEWTTLTNVSPLSVDSTVIVSDQNGPQSHRFYRLRSP